MKKSTDDPTLKENDLKALQAKADQLLQRHQQASDLVKLERRALVKVRQQVRNCKTAQKIVQDVAQNIQDKAHARIASVVSRCLQAVFDQPYQFRIVFQRKRGKTEAVLVFERGRHEYDPITMTGGGVVDVASLALRIASLNLSRPRRRQVLILDEPFKGLHSPVWRKRLRQLILTLSREMHIQFIIVTGIKDFEIGKVIPL